MGDSISISSFILWSNHRRLFSTAAFLLYISCWIFLRCSIIVVHCQTRFVKENTTYYRNQNSFFSPNCIHQFSNKIYNILEITILFSILLRITTKCLFIMFHLVPASSHERCNSISSSNVFRNADFILLYYIQKHFIDKF